MLAKQVLIISIIIPFVEYYSFVAVRKVIRKLDYRIRLSIWIFYSVLSVSVLLGLLGFRSWATGEWPSFFLKYVVSFLIAVFLGKVLVAAVMLPGDLMLVLKKAFDIVKTYILLSKRKGVSKPSGKHTITRSAFVSHMALFVGAVLTSGLIYGRSNRYNYKVRRIQLPLNGLPTEFKGLKIVQISDIHSGSFDDIKAVSEGVNAIMAERPDIVVFTGDLVNYRASEIEPYLSVFKRLQAPLGIYSILGNHDYGDYLSWPSEQEKRADFEQLLSHQKTMGWKLLRNTHQILHWKGSHFALIGVENWSTHARFPKYGNLKKAMSGIKDAGPPLKILLSHDPTHWDAEVRKDYPGIYLTLSGHTHGMQLGVDIPALKWSPAQYMYKQWAGLYQESNQFLYVNRGFGFIGYEGRLGILPEITMISFT